MSKEINNVGPNGVGKTTFARSFFPVEARCPRFINLYLRDCLAHNRIVQIQWPEVGKLLV
jgi:predicted ABC-type ATPase